MQLDGYKSTEQWHAQHKHMVPSEFIFMGGYVPLEESQVANPEPVDQNYTPRPSLLDKLGDISFDRLVSAASLSPLEAQILKQLYVDNLTQQEVGILIGHSQGWVSKLRSKAILKLKRKLD